MKIITILFILAGGILVSYSSSNDFHDEIPPLTVHRAFLWHLTGIPSLLEKLSAIPNDEKNIPFYEISKGVHRFFLLGTHSMVPLEALPDFVREALYECDILIHECPMLPLKDFAEMFVPLEKSQDFQEWYRRRTAEIPPPYPWFEELDLKEQDHLQTMFSQPRSFFEGIDMLNMPENYSSLFRENGMNQQLRNHFLKMSKETKPCFITFEASTVDIDRKFQEFNIPIVSSKRVPQESLDIVKDFIQTYLDSNTYTEQIYSSASSYLRTPQKAHEPEIISFGKLARSSQTWATNFKRLMNQIKEIKGRTTAISISSDFLFDDPGLSQNKKGLLSFLKREGYNVHLYNRSQLSKGY